MTYEVITVIGMHNRAALPAALQDRILGCDLLVGGARHLAAFPDFGGERLVIGARIDLLLGQLFEAHKRGLTIVALASGDPMWYGFGATLRMRFAAADLAIFPAPSSAQLAFAALGEPASDALLLSAHGRPVWPVIQALLPEPLKAAILTDGRNPPERIARLLLDAGYPDCPAAVCERLASPDERIVRAPLSAIASDQFDPLNVLVLLPGSNPFRLETPFGLRDDELEHDGLITHLEVRAVALALLRLQSDSIVWDIGAGSGAVAIEAARIAWRGQVRAVERHPERMAALRRNLANFADGRVRAVEGDAPAACADWPRPSAIFIGGSGGRLAELLDFCCERLLPGGRIAINLVTLELLGETCAQLARHGLAPSVRQIAVSRSRPLRGQTYLAALNPVYIVHAEKT